VLDDAQENRSPQVYLSKGALVKETYAVFSAVHAGLPLSDVRQAVLNGEVCQKTSYETRRKIWNALHHCYLSVCSEWIGQALAAATREGRQSPEYLSLVYFYFALRDRLTFDFVTGPVWAQWQVFEASDEDRALVDGYNLLFRARGPAFLVEHSSLNHRYYTRKLWDHAISENAEVVTHGKMLGTIGHEQPIDDKALLEGKISHRVSKLWIDENSRIPGHPDARIGCIEILGLNTPAGLVLNGYLRGGVELPVSSRAIDRD
jgi:hypothetical protein